MADGKKTTHFSSSRKMDSTYRKPGRDLINKTVGINPDQVYKKLEPVVLHDADQGRRMAIDEYTKAEKGKSLELLYTINKGIECMDRHIATLIRESDRKKNQKKMLEFQMSSLGISIEKIQLASKQSELPYMLMESVEKEMIMQERKRKREEEEEEENRKRQRHEMIKVKEGVIISGDTQTEAGGDEGDKEEEEDILPSKKLVVQQSQIIKNQEELLQRQEVQLIALNVRIQQLEVEKAEQAEQMQQQAMQQTVQPLTHPQPQTTLPSVPSLSLIPILDDDDLAQLGMTQQPIVGSSTRGEFAIENIVKSEHLKFLPKFAASGEQSVQSSQNVEVVNRPPEGSGSIVYIPKKVNEQSMLVLVPPTQKRINTKRSNPGIPVAKTNRDPTRHYCKNCACHYKEKSDLNKHVKYNCMNTNYDYICNACQKQFHTDYSVREHYYQEHKKEHLYFCRRCGKGFFHKSYKSNHKKICPKKGQEEKFDPGAPVD